MPRSRSPRQWSIAIILRWGILTLVALQSCLLLGAFLAGGVLTNSKDYASQVFAEKVANRLLVLQNDMTNRWTQLDDTAEQLAVLPFVDAPNKATQEDMRAFWQQACPLLLRLMRTAGVTDSFIILTNSGEEDTSNNTTHKALYLRKTDPLQDDTDTNILVGSPQLSLDMGIYFSPSWTPELTLTPQNRTFFDKPLSLVATGIKPSLMAYWGKPASILGQSGQAITYTMPLLDDKGVVRGVLGVGMLTDYFDMLLPAHELAQDGLGYFLAIKSQNDTDFYPLIYTRDRQRELFPAGKPIGFTPQNPAQNIFQVIPLTARPDSDSIAACALPLDTYAAQTPFAEDTWYLVGLATEKKLYAFPTQIRQILIASLAASLVLGGILSLLFSRRITGPIVSLAHSVESCRDGMLSTFPRTGVMEIDRLTSAIENANRNMVNTTARLMRIVDMAKVPFGAFELKPNIAQVFATERLGSLLRLSEPEANTFYNDAAAFTNYLRQIMSHPEPEEEAVYKLSDDPEHWVKIHLSNENGDILGLVSDATDEMLQKRRMRHDRDYDTLTGLCSRTFFRRQVVTLMELNYILDMAALIMLDLDDFKTINETYGSACGDEYLNIFARHMANFSGIHSILGRRSGDEFFVFTFRLGDREALRERVRQFYENLRIAPFIFPDGSMQTISVSIGVAWFNGGGDFEGLLRAADIALAEAKTHEPGTMREYKK